MQIVGLDGGNKNVKIFSNLGHVKFISNLGEYRERNLTQVFGADDMIYEYEEEKGFAGTLAKYESEFVREMMGESKAHRDLLIRVLLGLHKIAKEDTQFKIVVGQPISKHRNEEKVKIKTMLKGLHKFTVNGVTKQINILDVEVAAEGACAFWSNPKKGLVHILDFGSGTVNGATLLDGRYIDKNSFTIPYGMESTITKDTDAMAKAVSAHALKKWDVDEPVLLAGGAAETMYAPMSEYFSNISILRPKVENNKGVSHISPIYANAVAMYNIGREVFKDGDRE